MTNSVLRYVQAVIASAVGVAAATFVLAPAPLDEYAVPVLMIFVLCVLAELLVYELPGDAQGSIAYIPSLAGVIISPNWTIVLAVALAHTTVEIIKRRGGVKAAFNVAQITLAICAAVFTYRGFGGELAGSATGTFTAAVKSSLVSAIAMAGAYFLVNSTLVSFAIALSSRRKVIQTWCQNTLSMATFDVLASPVVLFLAWLYVKGGPLSTVMLALPMFGVRQLYATNARLGKVNQELLELMVKAIEARDPYTSGHSRRVSHYAGIIARAIGLSHKDAGRVATAALLHDVGKIHESFAPILQKPGRLSPEEWALMQTHSLKSAELVGTVSHLRDIVAAVRHHHENWDGTGYPDGLKGEEIPIESRIVIFADMIDAMTTDRPYRQALGEAEVRAELVKCRGRQFDPFICDKLLASPSFRLLFALTDDRRTCADSATCARSREGRVPIVA